MLFLKHSPIVFLCTKHAVAVSHAHFRVRAQYIRKLGKRGFGSGVGSRRKQVHHVETAHERGPSPYDCRRGGKGDRCLVRILPQSARREVVHTDPNEIFPVKNRKVCGVVMPPHILSCGRPTEPTETAVVSRGLTPSLSQSSARTRSFTFS